MKRPTKGQIAKRLQEIGAKEGLTVEFNAAEMLVEQVRQGSGVRVRGQGLGSGARARARARDKFLTYLIIFIYLLFI